MGEKPPPLLYMCVCVCVCVCARVCVCVVKKANVSDKKVNDEMRP